jgi:glycosyltransferase involved in cell wall biosynthesis
MSLLNIRISSEIKLFFLVLFFLIISKKSMKELLSLYYIRKEIYNYRKVDFLYYLNETFPKIKEPKVSIIITLFNQKDYLLKIYSCILRQSLKEVEIIFIDDDSKDYAYSVVKKLQKKDKRIIYLKNKRNKGQFYSRNKGILSSKGEYIIIIDPDDLLLNDILIKCYDMGKRYNLDIVQFYHIMGDYKKNKLIILNENSGIVYQPQTNDIFFNYETRYLWDKLVKKSVLIKSIYFMKKKYRKVRFMVHNDDTACFGMFKSAYSYGLLKEIGYFYYRENKNSTSQNNFTPENINGRFHSLFTTMDYYYEQSENNTFEKTKGGFRFFEYRIIRRYANKISLLTNGFNYIDSVINKYINSPYFNSTQKKKLISFKNKVNIQKINVTKEKGNKVSI